jgi:hypothetical protein
MKLVQVYFFALGFSAGIVMIIGIMMILEGTRLC